MMKGNQTPWLTRRALLLAGALLAAVFIAGRQSSAAQAAGLAAPDPQMAGPDSPAPAPAFFNSQQLAIRPAVLSPTLSYYFISGNTFTAYGGTTAYFRQASGCVNQMPWAIPLGAGPLPQGSGDFDHLHTYDSPASATTNNGDFI
jgi:hypothetical protein